MVVHKFAIIVAFIIVVIDAIISYSLKSAKKAITAIQDTASRESG
jgi:uncharacterized membrane protein